VYYYNSYLYSLDGTISCVQMCECYNGGGIHFDDVAPRLICCKPKLCFQLAKKMKKCSPVKLISNDADIIVFPEKVPKVKLKHNLRETTLLKQHNYLWRTRQHFKETKLNCRCKTRM